MLPSGIQTHHRSLSSDDHNTIGIVCGRCVRVCVLYVADRILPVDTIGMLTEGISREPGASVVQGRDVKDSMFTIGILQQAGVPHEVLSVHFNHAYHHGWW